MTIAPLRIAKEILFCIANNFDYTVDEFLGYINYKIVQFDLDTMNECFNLLQNKLEDINEYVKNHILWGLEDYDYN